MSYLGNPGSNKIITTDAGGRLLPSTTGPGVSLSGGALSLGGNLPAVGDYTWIPSGSGPYANQGTAGAAQAIAGPVTSPGSAGLWSSGRTGIRSYSTTSNGYAFSASNTFTASWQSTSFTIECYFQIDYQQNRSPGGDSFAVVFNDFGLGQNAVYMKTYSTGASVGYSIDLYRANGLVSAGSIPQGMANCRPIHFAFVLDRSNAASVTSATYIDGVRITFTDHGALGAFTNPFNQFQLFLGGLDGSGIVGWVNLTSSAKTAAQIRANTLLLKAA